MIIVLKTVVIMTFKKMEKMMNDGECGFMGYNAV
jgi:hypothetical protein